MSCCIANASFFTETLHVVRIPTDIVNQYRNPGKKFFSENFSRIFEGEDSNIHRETCMSEYLTTINAYSATEIYKKTKRWGAIDIRMAQQWFEKFTGDTTSRRQKATGNSNLWRLLLLSYTYTYRTLRIKYKTLTWECRFLMETEILLISIRQCCIRLFYGRS